MAFEKLKLYIVSNNLTKFEKKFFLKKLLQLAFFAEMIYSFAFLQFDKSYAVWKLGHLISVTRKTSHKCL